MSSVSRLWAGNPQGAPSLGVMAVAYQSPFKVPLPRGLL